MLKDSVVIKPTCPVWTFPIIIEIAQICNGIEMGVFFLNKKQSAMNWNGFALISSWY
jgi:hypothetical protein